MPAPLLSVSIGVPPSTPDSFVRYAIMPFNLLLSNYSGVIGLGVSLAILFSLTFPA